MTTRLKQIQQTTILRRAQFNVVHLGRAYVIDHYAACICNEKRAYTLYNKFNLFAADIVPNMSVAEYDHEYRKTYG